MTQITLDWARSEGDAAILRAQVAAEHQSPDFTRLACAYALSLIATRGPMPGEDIVDACKAAGYVVREDRAYGAVFRRMLREGAGVVGYCPRRKGHGSAGGRVYGIAA